MVDEYHQKQDCSIETSGSKETNEENGSRTRCARQEGIELFDDRERNSVFQL